MTPFTPPEVHCTIAYENDLHDFTLREKTNLHAYENYLHHDLTLQEKTNLHNNI